MARFLVIDIDGGDALGAHESREESLAYVGRLLATNGRDYAHDLEIVRLTPDGKFVEPVGGTQLLEALDELEASARRRREVGSAAGSPSGGHPIAARPVGD